MGWAQANLYYDKVAAPPAPGSLQEVLCILVQQYRREQELSKLIVLSSTDEKTKRDAFAAYQRASAPYIEHNERQYAERMKNFLEKLHADGPIVIYADDEEGA